MRGSGLGSQSFVFITAAKKTLLPLVDDKAKMNFIPMSKKRESKGAHRCVIHLNLVLNLALLTLHPAKMDVREI